MVTFNPVPILKNTTFSNVKKLKNVESQKAKNGKITVRISTTAALVSLLATCSSPSYAIATHYQHFNNNSFNYVDTVAVRGNNAPQELQKLLTTVQHHTIVDVFLCLSFASLPFTGELRLAIAFFALWWGGHGNKPFIRRIPCAVLLRFLNLPAALHFGQIIKTSLPIRKV